MSINFDPNQGTGFNFSDYGFNFDTMVITLANVTDTSADVYVVASAPIASFRIELIPASMVSFTGFSPGGPLAEDGAPAVSVFGTSVGEPPAIMLHEALHNQYGYHIPNNGGAPIYLGKLEFDASGIDELAINGHPNNTSADAHVEGDDNTFMVIGFANQIAPENQTYDYGDNAIHYPIVAETVSYGPPSAIITAPNANVVVTSGTAVQFQGETSTLSDGTVFYETDGSGLNFYWDFPDGQTSESHAPLITFPEGEWTAGTVLTVTDTATGYTDVANLDFSITVQPAPDYSLSATVTTDGPTATFAITIGSSYHHAQVNIYDADGNFLSNNVVPQPSADTWVANIQSNAFNVGYDGTFTAYVYGLDEGNNVVGDQSVTLTFETAQAPPDPVLTIDPATQTHNHGDNYDPMVGVSAVSSAGADVTSAVQVSGDTVDPSVAGAYQIQYSVNSDGVTLTGSRTVNVRLATPTISVAASSSDPQGVIEVSVSHGDSFGTGVNQDGNGYPDRIKILRSRNTVWPYVGDNNQAWATLTWVDTNVGGNATYADTDVQPGATYRYYAVSASYDEGDVANYVASLQSGTVALGIAPDQAPTLSLDSSFASLEKGGGGTITDPVWTATDPEGYTDFTLQVTYSGSFDGNLSLPSSVTDSMVGTHTFTYTVTEDTTGVASNSVNFTVTVSDHDLSVTSLTVDTSSGPAVATAVIAFGESVDNYDFVVKDANNSPVWTETVAYPANGPHTYTSGALATGTYSWELYAYDGMGQPQGSTKTGTFEVEGAITFHSVAVTADALPWSMANIRWGLEDGENVPSDMYVQIERKEGQNGSWTTLTSTQVPGDGGLNGSVGSGYYDEGLTAATTYYYRLIFTDSNGVQGDYSTELEYATIAIPVLATADVNTRGAMHPTLTITGTEVKHWYWTTGAVVSPETRTKDEWDADANANYVSNGGGGNLFVVMKHLGETTDNNGRHVPGAYTVTVCGFWADGSPITADMNDPSDTTNTVHAIPYNVYRGDYEIVESFRIDSDWVVRGELGRPNDEFDWHTVKYDLVSSGHNSLDFLPGLSQADWGVGGTSGVVGRDASSQAATSEPFMYLAFVTCSDENTEAIGHATGPVNGTGVWLITLVNPKGVDTVTTTVSGDNLADAANVSHELTTVGFFSTPDDNGVYKRVRWSHTPPPSEGPQSLANWGELADPNSGSTGTIVVEEHVKTPGSHTVYFQACFADGTPIGSSVSSTYSIAQRDYTGLTDLKFVTDSDGLISLEAYGYFPQWRYYIGVLPYRTEAGSDMSADPNGVAVDGDVQTPDTEPSKVSGVPIEANKRIVVVGVATDGQYLVGKPLIRVAYYGARTPVEEASIRKGLAEAFDPNDILVAGSFTKELDEEGRKKKAVQTTTVPKLLGTVLEWQGAGLTETDMLNWFIRPDGGTRSLADMGAYLVPIIEYGFTVVGQDENGADIYGGAHTYRMWNTTDGSAHMGVDFSAELVSDFAGVDNALVTYITTYAGEGLTFTGVIDYTAGVDLTGSGNGTEPWPGEFVKERIGEIRKKGLISRDEADALVYGKRTTAVGATSDTPYLRADVVNYYPDVVGLEGGKWTMDDAEEAGFTKITPREAYSGGLAPAKVRTGTTGKVAPEDFFKRVPRVTTHITSRPPTTSSRRAPTGAVTVDLTLDFINDRPAAGLSVSGHTFSTPDMSDGAAVMAEVGGIAQQPNAYYAGSKVVYEPKDNPYSVSFGEVPSEPPEVHLFQHWAQAEAANVPLEILVRYLEFGNAATSEALQHIYDLEVTGTGTAGDGTGRDRTDWKDALINYAGRIGATINP